MDRLAQEVLRAGIDDWVPLVAIRNLAHRLGFRGQDVVDHCLVAIGLLIRGGYAQVGEVSDGGFFEWDVTEAAALSRISQLWDVLGEGDWEFSCWLCNTPSGDQWVRQASGESDGCPQGVA